MLGSYGGARGGGIFLCARYPCTVFLFADWGAHGSKEHHFLGLGRVFCNSSRLWHSLGFLEAFRLASLSSVHLAHNTQPPPMTLQ